MKHWFDVDIAEKHGVYEAILIDNIAHWIKKNKENDKNFHDGRYWTYNSTKAFSALFPYMSQQKIKRHLKSLIEKNILQTGNFNDNKYDRTLWYTIIDENINETYRLHCTELNNGKIEIVQSYKETDSKPYSKHISLLKEKRSFNNSSTHKTKKEKILPSKAKAKTKEEPNYSPFTEREAEAWKVLIQTAGYFKTVKLDIEKFMDDIDKLQRLDGLEPGQIISIREYLQRDVKSKSGYSWTPQIGSPGKLRKRDKQGRKYWEVILQAMNQEIVKVDVGGILETMKGY